MMMSIVVRFIPISYIPMAEANWLKGRRIALSLTPMREKAICCAKALSVAPWSTTENVLVHVLVEWTQAQDDTKWPTTRQILALSRLKHFTKV